MKKLLFSLTLLSALAIGYAVHAMKQTTSGYNLAPQAGSAQIGTQTTDKHVVISGKFPSQALEHTSQGLKLKAGTALVSTKPGEYTFPTETVLVISGRVPARAIEQTASGVELGWSIDLIPTGQGGYTFEKK